MRKVFYVFILFVFCVITALPSYTETLPALPKLPSEAEFDTVIPPDDLDVFAPGSIPSPSVTPKNTPTQSSPTIKVTPVNNGTTKVPQQVVQKTQSSQTTKSSTTVQPTKTTTVKNESQKTSGAQGFKILPKGKKFSVTLSQSVSSNSPVGTKLTFKSLYPETSTYVTIPAGTVFYGQVSDSHKPQYTGNGGLIVIDVSKMVYNGKTYPIDAKISVANEKRIFFNNIKGQRMYLRSFPKAMNKGTTYFRKMWKVTKRLGNNESGVEIILTPFSFLSGTVVYVVNFAASPVLALFYKGKSITIPANSKFVIQLRKDVAL